MVQYRNPITGEKKHYQTFTKLKDAQKSANELRSVLDSGKIPEKRATRLNPLTFSQVADSLRDEWNSRHKRKELSEKTFTEYCIWLGALERTFGGRLLCQISRDEIISYRDETG